jgi:ketosteroid isomerase-like protein
MDDNRAIVERFINAMAANDIEAQERLLADDVIEEYPQSGEVIHGKQNRRSIMENYPGGTPQVREAKTQPGSGTRTASKISGGGAEYTAAGQVTYPNGETWHVIALFELRDGKISKMTTYFGAPFEAPAWRAPFVENTLSGTTAR